MGRKQLREREKHSYSNCVNIHGYRSNFGYINNYSLSNVGSFLVKMCKFMHFLYYTPAGVNALKPGLFKGVGEGSSVFLKKNHIIEHQKHLVQF